MSQSKKVYCVVPVYNDWESFAILAGEIGRISQQQDDYDFSLIAVNDGSAMAFQRGTIPGELPITVLNLKINIGHQRAIAVGIQYVNNEIEDAGYIIVMDSDGEDKPQDIMRLIEKAAALHNTKIIFAQRQKREASVLFKTAYFLYRCLFYFMTGQKINFGNFSIIPSHLLGKVANQNNIWNHYSGGIIQSKIPFDKILLDRGKRYEGSSKMNFNSLLIHGLSSIAVYFDFLSIRILRFSLYGMAICFVGVLCIVFQKLFTDTVILSWASNAIFIISAIILQLFSVTLIVLLLQLSSRKNITAPNSKIYLEFIESKEN